jgi:hypothetical protein
MAALSFCGLICGVRKIWIGAVYSAFILQPVAIKGCWFSPDDTPQNPVASSVLFCRTSILFCTYPA